MLRGFLPLSPTVFQFFFSKSGPVLLPDSEDQALSKLYGPGRGAESEPSSYTSLTEPSLSGDYSPPSSPEKEPGGEWSLGGAAAFGL